MNPLGPDHRPPCDEDINSIRRGENSDELNFILVISSLFFAAIIMLLSTVSRKEISAAIEADIAHCETADGHTSLFVHDCKGSVI